MQVLHELMHQTRDTLFRSIPIQLQHNFSHLLHYCLQFVRYFRHSSKRVLDPQDILNQRNSTQMSREVSWLEASNVRSQNGVQEEEDEGQHLETNRKLIDEDEGFTTEAGKASTITGSFTQKGTGSSW